ncbi:SDR family NAD(P)-dependent oxidoreductase [Novosphingobium sp. PY1]|jgi:NAD(P)-dependent dehydrogenase (short-subunit alcohol dehydrogenase family)|uniref:SDR family NAD(P)-dependent oxidoreductase n=1 Tax=Novosphingobium sp. PY1 TaxID=1882221 RepID=UPI001A8D7262|nr:SDR family oxidoreductase [Novosphingobium sp. PY1]GFM28853.1 short-chain dehydrogenase/reductase SDR [Novosphingobium sp. PY1]
MLFAGKKALITGAASGIGRATAIRFAEEGAQVTIGDRNLAGLEETAAMMATRPVVQHYDAMDHASSRRLVEVATKDGLDILCNISGLLKWGPSDTFALEDFEQLMTINATSVFVLCQAALPYLVKSKGNIVNTASTAALQGIAYTIAYSASKHAVAAITKGLAIEYGSRGVRVNAICPGHVETPMTQTPPPAGDVDWTLVMRNSPKLENGSCAPEDIAEMFAFLASDKARKVTGSLFTVDGGQLAG